MKMKKYNLEFAIWQSCQNCYYCNRGNYNVILLKCNKPNQKAKKWYCNGWETPCIAQVNEPLKECCTNWEIY